MTPAEQITPTATHGRRGAQTERTGWRVSYRMFFSITVLSFPLSGTSAREFEHELESLLECLVVLLESSRLESSNLDVNLADGVLSVASPTKGTWILNKHTPTRQIWLSSPVSGPRKFNFHSAARSAESTGEGWLGERDQTEELKTMIIDEWSAAFGVTIDRVEDFPIAHE